jgi:D-serine dehydratase
MNDTKDRGEYPLHSHKSHDLIQPLNKGLGPMDGELAAHDVPGLGWQLLREDLSLPTAVLYEDKLTHNLRWMQAFADAYGTKLAPHGKTTMAPKLFLRQIDAGAWGITLATAPQVHVAYEHGIRRVLMANQLVGKQNMLLISRLMKDSEFEFLCLVDSAEQVASLGKFFQDREQRLNVLIEVGADDGRTGIRNRGQLEAVIAALSDWRQPIALGGVEVYEGVLQDEASVRQLLKTAVDSARDLSRQGRFDRSPMILSGAGSRWYDIVAEVFSTAEIGAPVDVVLRPGCYLTHDVGAYRDAQQQIQIRNAVAKEMPPGLLPALQLWAYVQSVPEKEKAIVALGKRDAAFDSGLPVPALHYRPGNPVPTASPAGWTLTRLMDQHAFLHIGEGDDIHVGDMIAFDISHPCLTFDKWRYLPVLNSDYRVIDVVQTFF